MTEIKQNPICIQCLAASKTPRLPRGWKTHKEATYCDKCWRQKYTLRAISIPVLRPLGEGVGWPQFRSDLAKAWADSTACANWLSSEYYARDVRRDSITKKMPPMPAVYLYPEATKRFPELPTQAVAGMCQSVGLKYRSKRYDIVWTSAATNSNFRYPYPAAFPGQAWTPSYQPAGKDGGDLIPCVSVALRRGSRYLIQLRGGREFARQLRDFKALVSGGCVHGDITFYRQRVNGNDNRNGVGGRDSGDQKANFRVMCKMVGWFPKIAPTEATGVLRVRSDVDAMLVALNEKDERLWWLNADQVKRWTTEHRRNLQRWAEDQKHELRPNAPFQSRRESAANKFRNRISTWIKQSVAQVCGLAHRRRYAEVIYDDSERRNSPEFAWAELKSRLSIKCNEIGVKFTSSDEVETDSVDSARKVINQEEETQ